MGIVHAAGLDWFQEDFSHRNNFIDLFNMASGLKCTDPRDHIYSLLAYPLARIPGQKGPIVKLDYTKLASNIYYDFSMQLLRLPEGLRLLSAVQYDGKGPPMGYPSWVPF
jgi:hypothetical protein